MAWGKGKHDRKLSRRQLKRQQRRRRILREALEVFVYILVLCVAAYGILHYVGQRTVVSGESMEPTLFDGESLIVDKLSYHLHDPERYDIILFPGAPEDGERPLYVKRIIGLPGETVQIKAGKVYIDGECLLGDTYGITDTIEEAGIAETPLTLSDDEYFCLGDNRPVSYDSRYEEVGTVRRDEIVGKIWIRIWPPDKLGKVY